METDSSIVDISTSFRLLFFNNISVSFQIPIYSIIDVILANDTKVSQSIIGKIEYPEFSVLCLHEVVFHDNDETLWIITHSIRDVLLRHFIELITFTNHQVQ